MKKILWVLIVFLLLVECQTTKNSTYNSDEKIEQERDGNSGY